MVLYTSDGCTYTGMDEETVIRLRLELGRTTAYISKDSYDAIIQSQRTR